MCSVWKEEGSRSGGKAANSPIMSRREKELSTPALACHPPRTCFETMKVLQQERITKELLFFAVVTVLKCLCKWCFVWVKGVTSLVCAEGVDYFIHCLASCKGTSGEYCFLCAFLIPSSLPFFQFIFLHMLSRRPLWKLARVEFVASRRLSLYPPLPATSTLALRLWRVWRRGELAGRFFGVLEEA